MISCTQQNENDLFPERMSTISIIFVLDPTTIRLSFQIIFWLNHEYMILTAHILERILILVLNLISLERRKRKFHLQKREDQEQSESRFTSMWDLNLFRHPKNIMKNILKSKRPILYHPFNWTNILIGQNVKLINIFSVGL